MCCIYVEYKYNIDLWESYHIEGTRSGLSPGGSPWPAPVSFASHCILRSSYITLVILIEDILFIYLYIHVIEYAYIHFMFVLEYTCISLVRTRLQELLTMSGLGIGAASFVALGSLPPRIAEEKSAIQDIQAIFIP